MKSKEIRQLLEKSLEIKLLTVVDLVEIGSELGSEMNERQVVVEVLDAARFSAHFDGGAKDRQIREFAEKIGLIPSS